MKRNQITDKGQNIKDEPEIKTESEQPINTSPQLPQSIQFQIPTQTQATQGQSQVETLLASGYEAVKEGNVSEAQVSSQIILISSAILAIVGVFALNTESSGIQWPEAVLILLAIFGLGLSLLTGVYHFASERKFWYQQSDKIAFALGVLDSINNPIDKNNGAVMAAKQLSRGSNRTAFRIQLSSFTVGVICLLILIIGTIIQNVE